MADILIVTPAYNAEKYLAETIESVLAQTYTDWQLIIVDDGSIDSTLSIAQRYAGTDGRIVVHHTTNQGLAKARNNAFDVVDVPPTYLLFLDSDDVLLPDALQTLKNVLDHDPNVGAVYGMPLSVEADGSPITHDIRHAFGYQRYEVVGRRLARVDPQRPLTFSMLVCWCFIETPGQTLIRYTDFVAAGRFDEILGLSEDWEFWLRLTATKDIACVLRFVIRKREHPAGLSKQGKRMALAEPRIRHKLSIYPLFTAEQRRIARWGYFYSCYIKLTWAKIPLQNRQYSEAAKVVYRALRHYARFVQTTLIP